MFSLIINSLKALLFGLWLLASLSLVSLSPLPAQSHSYVLALACGVLIVHFIEFIAMKATLKRKADLEMSFVQTMLWGFGYWLPILKNIDKAQQIK